MLTQGNHCFASSFLLLWLQKNPLSSAATPSPYICFGQIPIFGFHPILILFSSMLCNPIPFWFKFMFLLHVLNLFHPIKKSTSIKRESHAIPCFSTQKIKQRVNPMPWIPWWIIIFLSFSYHFPLMSYHFPIISYHFPYSKESPMLNIIFLC